MKVLQYYNYSPLLVKTAGSHSKAFLCSWPKTIVMKTHLVWPWLWISKKKKSTLIKKLSNWFSCEADFISSKLQGQGQQNVDINWSGPCHQLSVLYLPLTVYKNGVHCSYPEVEKKIILTAPCWQAVVMNHPVYPTVSTWTVGRMVKKGMISTRELQHISMSALALLFRWKGW